MKYIVIKLQAMLKSCVHGVRRMQSTEFQTRTSCYLNCSCSPLGQAVISLSLPDAGEVNP